MHHIFAFLNTHKPRGHVKNRIFYQRQPGQGLGHGGQQPRWFRPRVDIRRDADRNGKRTGQALSVSGCSWFVLTHDNDSLASAAAAAVHKPHLSLLVRSTNDQRSVFAAIKGQPSPRFEDELIQSHPVAISGLRMRAVAGRWSTICVQLRDRSGSGVTERHKSVSDCARGRWSAMTDRCLCVWSLLRSVVIVPDRPICRLFDVIREADYLTMRMHPSSQ